MKKCFSIGLVMVLLCSMLSPVFAADRCNCGFTPVIYVGALGCTDIVRDAGTDKEQTLWKTDTDFLLENGKQQLPTLLRAAATADTELLGDALIAFANAAFGDLALDENGQSKPNVTTPSLNTPENGHHTPDSNYYFNYDFRLDPCMHAARLHTFIQEVKRLTGHERVQLKCSSMGGVVLSAYLAAYGTQDIETILCQCCPLQGTAVAGELFCGKFMLNADALKNYARDAIPYLGDDDFLEGSLYALTGVLDSLGVWDLLIALGDRVTQTLLKRVYAEVLIPIFGSMPGIWSFVPEAYYNEALSFMGLTPATGDLYRQVASYRACRQAIAQRLQAAKQAGVKVYIFCGYNVQRTPLVTAYKNTSDGTVDTKYASLGATCGDYKQPLSDAYLAAMPDTRYLSADHMVDASTGALPENTWFLRDWLHCNGNDAIGALYRRLLTTEEQLTVFSMQEYPQFLQNDDAGILTPITGAPDMLQNFQEQRSYLNFWRLLLSVFEAMLQRIETFLKRG